MKEQMKGGGDKMNINLPYIKMMREKKRPVNAVYG